MMGTTGANLPYETQTLGGWKNFIPKLLSTFLRNRPLISKTCFLLSLISFINFLQVISSIIFKLRRHLISRTSAKMKFSTYSNKRCNNWSEVSKEYIIYLYAEILKLSVRQRVRPHLEVSRNTTAHGFSSGFFLEVFSLYGHQRSTGSSLAMVFWRPQRVNIPNLIPETFLRAEKEIQSLTCFF